MVHDIIKYIGMSYSEINCWELVRKIYSEQLSIALPQLPIEAREMNNWMPVKSGHEMEGDLLIFRMKELKRHVAMVVGDGRMIHSDEKAGVVVEPYTGSGRYTQQWQNRLQKIYRHK